MSDQTEALVSASSPLAEIRKRYSNEQIDLYFLRPEPRSLEELATKFREQFIRARRPLISLGIAIAILLVFMVSQPAITFFSVLLFVVVLGVIVVSVRWLILMFKRDIVPIGREFYEEFEEFEEERKKWQRVKPPTEADFEQWIEDLREQVYGQAPTKLHLGESNDYKNWKARLKMWNAKQLEREMGHGAGYEEGYKGSDVEVLHPGQPPQKEWDFEQDLCLEGSTSPKYRAKLAVAGHEALLEGTRALSENCLRAVSRYLWVTKVVRILPFLGESDVEKYQRQKMKEDKKEEKNKYLQEKVVESIRKDTSIPVGRRTRLPRGQWHYSHYEFTRLFVTIDYIAIYTYNINIRRPDIEDDHFEHFYHEHLSYVSIRNTSIDIGDDVVKVSNLSMLLDSGHPITKAVTAIYRGGEPITNVDGIHEQLLKALRPHKMSMKETLDLTSLVD